MRLALVRYRRPLAGASAFLAVLLGLSTVQSATTDAEQGTVRRIDAALTPTTAAPEDGLVAAPVRLADPAVAELLAPGSIVDVLAADGRGQAAIVAESVKVLAVPDPNNEGWGIADSGGALVLLAVTTSEATELAATAAVGPLSVVLHA